ncbi:MAG: hypothetical protein R3D03_01580 [Geminicoccaceae bacterium]
MPLAEAKRSPSVKSVKLFEELGDGEFRLRAARDAAQRLEPRRMAQARRLAKRNVGGSYPDIGRLKCSAIRSTSVNGYKPLQSRQNSNVPSCDNDRDRFDDRTDNL